MTVRRAKSKPITRALPSATQADRTGQVWLHGGCVVVVVGPSEHGADILAVLRTDRLNWFASQEREGTVPHMKITAALLASLNVTRSQFNARMAVVVRAVTTNDRAVLAACQRLYAAQTAAERQADRTMVDNGVGFQEMDAAFGSRMARLIASGNTPWESNMPRLRRMAVKYRRQLTVLSILKDQAKAADLVWVLTEAGQWVDTRQAA